MKYPVRLTETVTSIVMVDANSPEEAEDLVRSGEFDGETISDRETADEPVAIAGPFERRGTMVYTEDIRPGCAELIYQGASVEDAEEMLAKLSVDSR